MRYRVLVVDDEPTITDMLRDVLSLVPYEIMSANSAEDALAILEWEQVDVVISDERMPGMSGSEFIALVRQKYPETIRIILTAYARLDAAIRAINEGEIYRFFTKPCSMIDLAVAIHHALQQKELTKERELPLELKRQSTFIERLEKQYPGITEVKRDAMGEIIIDDEIDREDGKPLLNRLVERCETQHPEFEIHPNE
jgi:two-component system probable response regulator PhcQ